MRDTAIRGKDVTLNVTREEKITWKANAMKFVRECRLEQEEEDAKCTLPKKLERLYAFYLLHAKDAQLRSMGLGGYAVYFKDNTPPGVAIEKRPLLLDNQDSYAVNVSKTFYLLMQRQSRLAPFWDFFHARRHMKRNSCKVCSIWAVIRLHIRSVSWAL